MDFIRVPVMKRVGIFKAPSWQHEASAIAASPWVQTWFLCQKKLLLKKYPFPRHFGCCCWPACVLGEGRGSTKRNGGEVVGKGKQTTYCVWEWAASVEEERKRVFVASQPFAGDGGFGAALGMGRDAQLCGLGLFTQMSLFFGVKLKYKSFGGKHCGLLVLPCAAGKLVSLGGCLQRGMMAGEPHGELSGHPPQALLSPH